MQSNKKGQGDKYFVIKTNNKIEEFITLEDCLIQSDKSIIVLDSFRALNEYGTRQSNFVFYSENGEEKKLSINGWTVEEIGTIKYISKAYLIITFSDPLKRIRVFNLEINYRNKYAVNYRNEYADLNNDMFFIIETNNKLKKLSQFQNWEQLDLLEENRQLKEENEKLKNK